MAASTLILLAFSATDDEPPNVVLTLGGSADLIPDGFDSIQGDNGTRVVRVPSGNTDALYSIGEAIAINDATQYNADVDGAFFEWFKAHFVPMANGGGYEPEPSPEAPVTVVDDTAPDAAPAEPAPPPFDLAAVAGMDRLERVRHADEIVKAMAKLKANEAKQFLKDVLGLKAVTSKKKAIDAATEHLCSLPDLLRKDVRAILPAVAAMADVEGLKILRALESEGQNREPVIAGIDAAIVEAEVQTIDPEPPAGTPEPEAAPGASDGSADPGKGKGKGKGKRFSMTDEQRAEAEGTLGAIIEPIRKLHGVLGTRRLVSAIKRIAMAPAGEIDVSTLIVSGSAGSGAGKKDPIGHTVGAVHTVTKKHRDDRGTCTYSVECLDGGKYKLVKVEGNRPDLKVGHVFNHGMDVVKTLTRRETGIPTVANWFNLG